MAAKLRKMEFDKLIAKGENPKGFTSQTVNGTGHAVGTGFNKDIPWEWDDQVEAEGPWQKPNSNRTSE